MKNPNETNGYPLFLDSILLKAAFSEKPPLEPFGWGDFTWLQGNTRQRAPLLESEYFTGSLTLDVNYNLSSNHPVDHTNSGSTVTDLGGPLGADICTIPVAISHCSRQGVAF